MRARPWFVVVVVLAVPIVADAGKLRDAAGNARGSSSRSSRKSSATPERTSASSSDDSDSDTGWALWQVLRIPVVVPQLVLESKGPRAFVYESRPYANHGKGIVRSKPWRLAPAGYMGNAALKDERERMPGQHVKAELSANNNGTPTSSAIEGAAELLELDETAPYRPELAPPLVPTAESAPQWRDGTQAWAVQVSADAATIDADM